MRMKGVSQRTFEKRVLELAAKCPVPLVDHRPATPEEIRSFKHYGAVLPRCAGFKLLRRPLIVALMAALGVPPGEFGRVVLDSPRTPLALAPSAEGIRLLLQQKASYVQQLPDRPLESYAPAPGALSIANYGALPEPLSPTHSAVLSQFGTWLVGTVNLSRADKVRTAPTPTTLVPPTLAHSL